MQQKYPAHPRSAIPRAHSALRHRILLNFANGRNTRKIAIATGDPAGIGPEISLKAARHPKVLGLCEPVLFGDRKMLAMHGRTAGISIVQVKQARPRIGTVAAAHGRAAVDAAEPALA